MPGAAAVKTETASVTSSSQSPIANRRAQILSHYPAIPPPIDVRLVSLPEHPCPYLPGRTAGDRALWANQITPEAYEKFMDAGFRRSGKLVYQPACRGCRECRPIRLAVADFRPDKSQRRCAHKNGDLRISHALPKATEEKLQMYQRYLRDWHGRTDVEDSTAFTSFLYESPLNTTVEFEYRDPSSRLLAVGICDVCPRSLSSVYFYFDPAEARRGLGTFGILCEIGFAAARGLPCYYLGYWVRGCAKMQYKNAFRPNELLDGDGVWRAAGE